VLFCSQKAVSSIPGANGSPLRSERRRIDANLDSYKQEHASNKCYLLVMLQCILCSFLLEYNYWI